MDWDLDDAERELEEARPGRPAPRPRPARPRPAEPVERPPTSDELEAYRQAVAVYTPRPRPVRLPGPEGKCRAMLPYLLPVPERVPGEDPWQWRRCGINATRWGQDGVAYCGRHVHHSEPWYGGDGHLAIGPDPAI